MTGGHSLVLSQKAQVDETFLRNSSNVCKSVVGTDASQLYPFSMRQICQQDCTRYGSLTPICRSLKLDITELATLRICSCLFTREKDQNVKLRALSHLENRKNQLFLRTVLVITVRQCSKQWDVTTTSVLVKKLVPS